LAQRPGKSYVLREPLGVALVIAPWNYPLQLLLLPMAAAIAAGNCVVTKPSELAPATSTAVARLLPRYLDPAAVAVVEGGVPETTALLAQRFDHIFYTGNGRVGRIVLHAAAEHLTPVTLELGGKSPAIVAADADLAVAARRIAWGKFFNAGQTCVAPDHVLVHRSVHARFVTELAKAVRQFYGSDPRQSADYARIVNDQHFTRVTGLLDAGGYDRIVTGGDRDAVSRYLAPTVVDGAREDSALMGEEIFGPVLPILPVDDVTAAVAHVNSGDKPLALYAFTGDQDTVDQILRDTSSGGVLINHTLLQLSVPGLPFGGVGQSGMGAYHGRWGFETFSHRRAVLHKPAKPDLPVQYPPYTGWKQKVLRKVL
jgi:aldehyde dehydrogenase (NAD+)